MTLMVRRADWINCESLAVASVGPQIRLGACRAGVGLYGGVAVARRRGVGPVGVEDRRHFVDDTRVVQDEPVIAAVHKSRRYQAHRHDEDLALVDHQFLLEALGEDRIAQVNRDALSDERGELRLLVGLLRIVGLIGDDLHVDPGATAAASASPI